MTLTGSGGGGTRGTWSSGSGRGSLLQVLLAALGLTELCCFFVVAPLVHSRHSAVYHWSGSAVGLFLPVFLDVFFVWVLLAVLVVWVEASGGARVAVWLGILLGAPAVVSFNWDLLSGGTVSWLTRWLVVCFVVGGVGAACSWGFWGKALSRVADFAFTLSVFFGMGSVLVLGQLAWCGWAARGLNSQGSEGAASVAVRGGAAARGGRIIWIVFDELSYQQVYERRFRGLGLPAFDGLAAEATVLTQTEPAGIFTDRVLPSLMTGRRIDVVRSSAGGALRVHDQAMGAWRAFDAHDTVFEDARRSGYRTRVAGWYVPYCRILSGVLDGCFWSYDIPVKNGLSSKGDLWSNSLAPFAYALSAVAPERWLSGVTGVGAFRVRGTERHIEDYESILGAAEAALRDRSAGFVLLHFPVPHLGGIYDRATGELTTGASSYLDNLALADRCLGQLRAALEETGQWDSSTVVVMGDHSWRMREMVPDSAVMQKEEMEASQGGHYDPRPVYVVKMAGQKVGARVDAPFSAVNTRSLLDGLMRGEVRTPEELDGVVRRLH